MSRLYNIAFLLLFMSCSSNITEHDGNTIFVCYEKEEVFDWNNAIQIESVVPLETQGDCLLSYARKCLISEHHIVYSDEKQKAIFVFDEKGTFLYSIDTIGNGPNEYTDIKDVAISSDNKFILVLDNSSLMSFDLKTGTFHSRISLPQDMASNFYQFANPEKHTFYFWSTEKEHSLYLYKDDKIKPIEEREGFPYVSQKFYYDSENTLNYISDYGLLEIHEVKEDSLMRKYSFDFGKLNLSKSQIPQNVNEFNQIDKDESFKCIMSAFETVHNLFVMTVCPDGLLYNLCVDKKTNEVKAGKQDENAPLLVIDAIGKYFYGIIYPYHFINNREFFELIQSYGGNAESNPMLVKFMFRE